MTRSIWKYPFDTARNTTYFRMPKGAKILTCQVQQGVPCLWALVNPQVDQMITRQFCVVGTGHPIDFEGEYIGTIQEADGALIWHVFEVFM